jgi:hypothetical protein
MSKPSWTDVIVFIGNIGMSSISHTDRSFSVSVSLLILIISKKLLINVLPLFHELNIKLLLHAWYMLPFYFCFNSITDWQYTWQWYSWGDTGTLLSHISPRFSVFSLGTGKQLDTGNFKVRPHCIHFSKFSTETAEDSFNWNDNNICSTLNWYICMQ